MDAYRRTYKQQVQRCRAMEGEEGEEVSPFISHRRISQNHRGVEVGRDLWRSFGPALSASRATCSRLPRTTSRRLLDISKLRLIYSCVWKQSRALRSCESGKRLNNSILPMLGHPKGCKLLVLCRSFLPSAARDGRAH
ncbi:uncharacterized protein LJ206_003157 [Theristicus caerulescens]